MTIRHSPRARNPNSTLRALWAAALCAVLALPGCGGGGGESPGPPHTVGGTVTGLSGSGLVLQDSGGDHALTAAVAANGAFTFATPVVDGLPYNVTVSTQPTHPSQTCSVAHGVGTVSGSDITNVVVSCVINSYTVGGTVTGHTGTGLVLTNEGGNSLTVTANGSFVFSNSVRSGNSYSVAVATQPINPPQACMVSNPTGTVGGSNVTNVAVSCTAITLTNAWGPAASMPNYLLFTTATLLSNGRVLVAGGNESHTGPPTSAAEVYDLASNSWSSAGNMSEPRDAHTATPLPDGKVLAAGGQGVCDACSAPPTASTDLYDPVANTWVAGASMMVARESHTATLLPNGKVLVAGGAIENDLCECTTSSAELYDPASNTWSSAGAMSTPRYSHTATLLPNGKVLVAGGTNSTPGPAQGILATAELYDPVANTWVAAGNMALARASHTATLLQNGKVLVAGGWAANGLNAADTAAAELYDPVANTWATAGSMALAREYHTATLLANGKVLVAGGNIHGPATASAELYDAVTNMWTSAGNMLNPHAFPTATLLPNGQVLVASEGTAELYYP